MFRPKPATESCRTMVYLPCLRVMYLRKPLKTLIFQWNINYRKDKEQSEAFRFGWVHGGAHNPLNGALRPKRFARRIRHPNPPQTTQCPICRV